MYPDPVDRYLLHAEQEQELWDRAESLRLGIPEPPEDDEELPY